MNNFSNRSISLGLVSIFLLALLPCFLSECLDDEPIKIQSVSPLIGCKGNTLSIIGWGFSANKSDNVVKVNGIAAEVIRAYTNMLVVTLPDTVTSGKITVKAGNNFISGPVYSITGPRYFIKFKLDGNQKYFDTCDPDYHSNSVCALGVVPFINDNNENDPHAVISICADVNKVTGSVMENWKGEKISFGGESLRAQFDFYDDAASYSSINTDSQNDSELTIINIIPDPSVIQPNVYIASGTFKCNVAPVGGDSVAVTEGEFSVRFTESH